LFAACGNGGLDVRLLPNHLVGGPVARQGSAARCFKPRSRFRVLPGSPSRRVNHATIQNAWTAATASVPLRLQQPSFFTRR
jgi:hypothetical protein